MIRAIIGFILSALFALGFTPIVISLASKMNASQPILHYVESHATKNGTPTFGGVSIVLSAMIPFIILFGGGSGIANVCLIVTSGYAVIGFTDDFIKVKSHHNEGLSPLWKLFLQFIIACIVSAYTFFGTAIGGQVLLPFTTIAVDFGYFALPYYVFIFLAFTNAVNLTDGLDGLAGNVTLSYLIAFCAVLFIITGEFSGEQTLAVCFIGALGGFLCYNKFPAKIFMGDTGSLALGGLLASLSVMTKLSLTSAILGIMYVVTALSVILQVCFYKLTKKRVFLMSPIHHHFEKKGVHENRIVTVYTIITALVGATVILLTYVMSAL